MREWAAVIEKENMDRLLGLNVMTASDNEISQYIDNFFFIEVKFK